MGKIYEFIQREKLSPEQRAAIILRITDLAIEIELLSNERKRLEEKL